MIGEVTDLPLRNPNDVSRAVSELLRKVNSVVKEVNKLGGSETPIDLSGFAPLQHRHDASEIDNLPSGGEVEWSDVRHTPNSRAGYGITDAAALVHTHPWAQITARPNNLAGYGITDAASLIHDHDSRYYTRPEIEAMLLGAGMKFKGAWDVTANYAIQDVVTRSSKLWLALTGSLGVVPVEGVDWTQIGVLGSAFSRSTVALGTAALADLAEEQGIIALGKSSMLLNVTTDVKCRVRLYSTAVYQAADLARAIGTDPVGEHGVMLDLAFPTGNLNYDLSPKAIVSNDDGPATTNIYYTVQNRSGGAAPINLTFTRIELEV